MFKFLGGLNRSAYEGGGDEERNINHDEEQKINNNTIKYDTDFALNEKNIETIHEKLNIKKYDLEFEYDPLFTKITEKFSNAGAKSLILKTQPMDCNLDILLESISGHADYYSDTFTKLDQSFDHSWKRIIGNVHLDKNLFSLEVFKNISEFISSRAIKQDKENSLINELLFPDNHENNFENDFEMINDLGENENLSECNTPKELLSSDGDLKNEPKDIFADFDINKENLIMNPQNNDHSANNQINTSNNKFTYNKMIIGEGNSNNIFKELNSKNFKNPSAQKLKKDNNIIISKGKKEKKEEILFNFCKENRVKKEEFFEKTSKKLRTVKIKNKKKKYLMKTPKFYNFQQEYLLRYWFDFDYYVLKGGKKFQEKIIMNEDLMNFDDLENTSDQKYMKHLENLCRKCDVKSVKEKIWEICKGEDQKKDVVFNEILSDLEFTNTEQINMTVHTCFVCLLHLANEKSLLLESKDDKVYININN